MSTSLDVRALGWERKTCSNAPVKRPKTGKPGPMAAAPMPLRAVDKVAQPSSAAGSGSVPPPGAAKNRARRPVDRQARRLPACPPQGRPAPQTRQARRPPHDFVDSPATPLPPRVPHTTLLAVTGMSPAVLTETAWALAREKPPTIPDQVVVVTTLPGKGRLEDELFTASPEYGGLGVWQALRRAILGPAFASDPRLNLADIRVVATRDAKQGRSHPLEDIRTPADNDTAADFILDEVRKVAANSDTRLIASLAGGRKTLGALLYAALSLLGRPQDRLTHVLVSEPFDDPQLAPRFYFPVQPATLHQRPRAGGVCSSDSARLWLADVPFVRLRELFPKQLGRYPGTFSALVAAYAQRLEEVTGPPEVALEPAQWTVRVNGTAVVLAAREFALFAFLCERCREGQPPYGQQKEAEEDFLRWLAAWGQRFGPFTRQRETADSWRGADADDFRRQLASLRRKFNQAGLGRLEPFLLPRRGAFGVRVRLASE